MYKDIFNKLFVKRGIEFCDYDAKYIQCFRLPHTHYVSQEIHKKTDIRYSGTKNRLEETAYFSARNFAQNLKSIPNKLFFGESNAFQCMENII